MGGRVRDVDGGILGLLDLLAEHRGAIDYDCLTLGLDINDLGTDRFPWSRLRAIVVYASETSALARSVHGSRASWSTTNHLLASVLDALNVANWQRTGRKGNRPKPTPRPGDEPSKNERRFGTASMPLDQAKEFFDRINRPDVTSAVLCADGSCDRSDVKARGLCGMHYQRWWRANRQRHSSP